MCRPKAPPPVEPAAPAPPPAQPAATVNQATAKSPEDVSPEKANIKARRKGRGSLRINLDAGVGGSATGINVPQG